MAHYTRSRRIALCPTSARSTGFRAGGWRGRGYTATQHSDSFIITTLAHAISDWHEIPTDHVVPAKSRFCNEDLGADTRDRIGCAGNRQHRLARHLSGLCTGGPSPQRPHHSLQGPAKSRYRQHLPVLAASHLSRLNLALPIKPQQSPHPTTRSVPPDTSPQHTHAQREPHSPQPPFHPA